MKAWLGVAVALAALSGATPFGAAQGQTVLAPPRAVNLVTVAQADDGSDVQVDTESIRREGYYATAWFRYEKLTPEFDAAYGLRAGTNVPMPPPDGWQSFTEDDRRVGTAMRRAVCGR